MKTVELKYMPGDECWVRGQYRVCCIDSVVLDETGVTYNWANYDYGVDVTELWDEGYFTNGDIGETLNDKNSMKGFGGGAFNIDELRQAMKEQMKSDSPDTYKLKR